MKSRGAGLLRRLPLDGSLVTADAMHTQTETARIIVQEQAVITSSR
jgi:predicted transposase YbfD/YdcC